MRKLIAFLVLLTAAMSAHAEPRYVSQDEWKRTPMTSKGMCLNNRLGGMILLANQRGKQIVLSTDPKTGSVILGEWNMQGENHVFVLWQHRTTSLFSVADLNPCVF